MSSGGFSARAQSAGDRNAAAMSSAAQQNMGMGSGAWSGGHGYSGGTSEEVRR